MTRMLASVSTLKEAEIAVAGGADLIDLKDPADAATGGMALEVIRLITTAVAGRRLVSAGAGDATLPPPVIAARVRELAANRVDYVKIAIGAGDDAAPCVAELTGLAPRVKLIAVFFADRSPDLSLLPLLGRSGFTGAMLDTQSKAAGRLLDHRGVADLLGFVRACHAAGLLAGLAGSLEMPDIPRLLVLAPDLLGFRGALRGPAGALDAERVRAVRDLIPPEPAVAGMSDVDYRRLPASRYAPAAGGDVPVDFVFVDDLVLPVFIGTYAREREAPQKVRFAVTASVVRAERVAEDMRDVFSYDLITDGIRVLVGSGHIALVETLAERIATMVLRHSRVTKVVVRVEKLETGSGVVGVEIERTRREAGLPVVGETRRAG